MSQQDRHKYPNLADEETTLGNTRLISDSSKAPCLAHMFQHLNLGSNWGRLGLDLIFDFWLHL